MPPRARLKVRQSLAPFMAESVRREYLGEAEKELSARGALQDLEDLAHQLVGTPLDDNLVRLILKGMEWRTDRKVWREREFKYDGFKNGVALEAISPAAQIEGAIKDLIKMEYGHRAGDVGVGILVVSTLTKKPESRRKEPYFDRAVYIARRLREVDLLRVPTAIIGVSTAHGRPRPQHDGWGVVPQRTA